jgi:hypothetical protein
MLMNPGNWQSLACTFEALKMAGYPDGQTKMTGPHRIAALLGSLTDNHGIRHPTAYFAGTSVCAWP